MKPEENKKQEELTAEQLDNVTGGLRDIPSSEGSPFATDYF
jgi:hypothetical protein